MKIALFLLFIASRLTCPAQQDPTAQRLRAGDTVDIRILNHEDLNFKGPIQANGAVELQCIGSVVVAGLTPALAKAKIQNLYQDGWLKKPFVTVNVSEFSKSTITVSGEVKNPGSYPIARNRSVSLLDAIAMSGYFTTRANKNNVTLIRNNQRQELKYKDIVKDPRKNITLQDGDLIVVKGSLY